MARAKDRKGVFGAPRLPVARSYPEIASRRKLPIVGGIAVASVLAFLFWSAVAGRSDLFSPGPLSSAHAKWEGDCWACHTKLVGLRGQSGLSSEQCSVCHEKYGDEIGVYTFVSHYLYRSNDFARLGPTENEVTCDGCHPEHRGREALITVVSDRECVSCHAFGSFNSDHPEFDAVVTKREDSALHFPHIQHVREVMGREQLVDIERACLYCHNGKEDGKNFEPISFDRHCDTCHLTATTATDRLPIATADTIGVLTLGMLQDRRPPGSNWVLFANPDEYQESRTAVRKVPLYHRDPWLTENLRRLRQQLYPNAGLADLLVASPDVPPHETVALYHEAIATLRERALELRSTPDAALQRQLRQIEGLLSQVERALDDPLTPLDESRFVTAFLEKNPGLDQEQVEAIEALVMDLSKPCRECHKVRQATIGRVAADQRTLRRAEFNHRAHIVQLRCLDCHTEIPFAEYLEGTETIAARFDSAEIVNLPAIESCRQCHNPEQSTNRCTSCHLFHADKSRHSELLLYFDAP